MQVTHEQQGNITVVSIVGSLDALTSPQLTDYLNIVLKDGNAKLVIDLAGLEYTSSAGLRVLLSMVKETRQHGGDLRLAAVQPNVKKIFEMSGFTSILKILPTVPAAVASYF